MEHLSNEEKAKEIHATLGIYADAYYGAMAMAKLKDEEHAKEKQQWIDKACEWLFKNTRFTTNDIRDFKNAMEEL